MSLNNKSFLYPYQFDAVNKMHNGCILNGGVGSGKSRTSLYYYFKEQGGSINPDYIPMKVPAKDLYIITTARKRDTLEWEGELSHFLMSTGEEQYKRFGNHIYIDSWNNIKKYQNIYGSFFIFDEQRLVGSGAWVKAFYKIAIKNKWILLSATPGDSWSDYIPVFVANGFYKNKTEFIAEHVVYSRFSKYPKIERYINIAPLIEHKNAILINMDFKRDTVQHHENVYTKYDENLYKLTFKKRWDPFKDEPIQQISSLCYILRKIVNDNPDRIVKVCEILEKCKKAIIFYNFDYELEALLNIDIPGYEIKQWNGHKHEDLPTSDNWIYLVQYSAGAEGWNCIYCDTIIFYSQNYSYKIMEQASGRIDRLNTPYKDLYYYHLKSKSGIDLAISRALSLKKNFNENNYISW